jgi:hypothetical protein
LFDNENHVKKPDFLLKGSCLLDLIISHLSNESKDNLMSQCIHFSTNSYKKPLFNYINFCKHLNLNVIKELVGMKIRINYYFKKLDTDIKIRIIHDEIIRLFINENIEFTHLYIPQNFDYPIHLIPEAKHCFSSIEFISLYTNVNDNGLAGLIEMCKSIKELELIINKNDNNYEISSFINNQESLFNVRF